MSNELKLAKAFTNGIRYQVKAREFSEIKKRNSTPDYAGDICASHDFCDANMVMYSAFKEVFGREPNIGSDDESDCILWSNAWGIAKNEMLSTNQGRNAR